MTPSPRRRSLAVLTLAVAVLAAGCGVRGDADPTATGAHSARSPRFLLAAGAATAKVPTEQMQVTTEVTTGGRTMTVTMHAQVDGAAHRSKLSIDYGDAVPGLGSSEPLTVIQDGSTAYLSGGFLSLFTGLGQDHRPWLRFDSSELDAFGGQQSPGFVSDPAALLDYLKGVSGPITTVGSEPVRGVDTTHLRTELDLAKAFDQAAPGEAGKLRGLFDQLGGSGAPSTMPADIWVDGSGLVRRLRLTPKMDGAADMSMAVTVEFYGFGDPVTVTVPPADQVQDLSKALPDLGSLLGGN